VVLGSSDEEEKLPTEPIDTSLTGRDIKPVIKPHLSPVPTSAQLSYEEELKKSFVEMRKELRELRTVKDQIANELKQTRESAETMAEQVGTLQRQQVEAEKTIQQLTTDEADAKREVQEMKDQLVAEQVKRHELAKASTDDPKAVQKRMDKHAETERLLREEKWKNRDLKAENEKVEGMYKEILGNFNRLDANFDRKTEDVEKAQTDAAKLQDRLQFTTEAYNALATNHNGLTDEVECLIQQRFQLCEIIKALEEKLNTSLSKCEDNRMAYEAKNRKLRDLIGLIGASISVTMGADGNTHIPTDKSEKYYAESGGAVGRASDRDEIPRGVVNYVEVDISSFQEDGDEKRRSSRAVPDAVQIREMFPDGFSKWWPNAVSIRDPLSASKLHRVTPKKREATSTRSKPRAEDSGDEDPVQSMEGEDDPIPPSQPTRKRKRTEEKQDSDKKQKLEDAKPKKPEFDTIDETIAQAQKEAGLGIETRSHRRLQSVSDEEDIEEEEKEPETKKKPKPKAPVKPKQETEDKTVKGLKASSRVMVVTPSKRPMSGRSFPSAVYCPKCFEQFSSEAAGNSHVKTCLKGRLPCPIQGCSKQIGGYTRYSDLRRHFDEKHSNVSVVPYRAQDAPQPPPSETLTKKELEQEEEESETGDEEGVEEMRTEEEEQKSDEGEEEEENEGNTDEEVEEGDDDGSEGGETAMETEQEDGDDDGNDQEEGESSSQSSQPRVASPNLYSADETEEADKNISLVEPGHPPTPAKDNPKHPLPPVQVAFGHDDRFRVMTRDTTGLDMLVAAADVVTRPHEQEFVPLQSDIAQNLNPEEVARMGESGTDSTSDTQAQTTDDTGKPELPVSHSDQSTHAQADTPRSSPVPFVREVSADTTAKEEAGGETLAVSPPLETSPDPPFYLNPSPCRSQLFPTKRIHNIPCPCHYYTVL
jgi:hypothetical protein